MQIEKSYKEHLKEITMFSLPIVGGQIGHIVASIADNVMVGHIGSTELAAVSFANNIFFIFFLIGIGLSIGLTPLVAKQNIAGNKVECRRFLKNGILTNSIFAVAMFILLMFISYIMPYMGQPEAVTDFAIPYFRLLVWSIIPYMVFVAFKQFLEGISKPAPANMILLVANVFNIGLNYVLIFGHLGFEQMGIIGAGVATLISRMLMLVAVIFLMYYSEQLKYYVRSMDFKRYSLEKMKQISKIGFPIGLQYFFEVGAFSAGGIIMGWVGKDQLAAHQIALNLAGIPFMLATGIGSAVTITMSNYRHQNRFADMRKSAHTALLGTVIFMAFTASIFMIFNEYLPSLYNDEVAVLGYASSFMIMAAFFQFSDGLQAVLLGLLRGLEDVKIPAYVTSLAYWFVAIPACYLLTFNFEMGGVGVWWGYLIGLTITASLLFVRFEYLRKKISLK